MKGKGSPEEVEFAPLPVVQLTDAQVEILSRRMRNGDGDEVDEHEEAVQGLLRRRAAQEEAQRRYDASQRPALPLPPVGDTLVDALARAPKEIAHTIEGLHITGANTLLVARFKAGKTTFAANILKALVDGEPCLGCFDTHFPDGRVAYLNYEVSEDQFVSWLRDLDLAHPERVVPVHLRGQRLPFWLPAVRDDFAAWLKANDVRYLVLDPVGRAWRGLVDNENDNSGVRGFTDALDELKGAADVPDSLTVHHTGRKEHESDAEHSRGATALEDWMDAGWYLTKERDGTRMLRAEGRDVELPATELHYDKSSRALSFTGRTRAVRRHEDHTAKVLEALAELERDGQYPASVRNLRAGVQGIGKDDRAAAIKATVDAGLVTVELGSRSAKLHSFTESGRSALAGEGDDDA